jgi:hypothetical protein
LRGLFTDRLKGKRRSYSPRIKRFSTMRAKVGAFLIVGEVWLVVGYIIYCVKVFSSHFYLLNVGAKVRVDIGLTG